jgi:ABC-type branched-subunit amino acid transport system substrate-binding protein
MQKAFLMTICRTGRFVGRHSLDSFDGGGHALERKGHPRLYAKRRTMIVRSFAAIVFASAVSAFTLSAQSGALHLRIGLVTPAEGVALPSAASVARGVRLGAAEANQTAALFAGDVQLFEARGSGPGAIAAANGLLSGRKVQVLVATSAADAEALSRLAESRGVIFLNAVSRSQAFRSACRRFTFHIEATDAMYANAAGTAQSPSRSGPAARRAPSQRVDSVVLWAPALERFGASQINERYRDKYHQGMDGSAWAGWAAVKIATDAALRAQSTVPTKLVAYLESPSTEFDGHKGWPLTFRVADHQLREPLYIVVTTNAGGRRVQSYRDVPELRGVLDETESDDSESVASDRVLDGLIGASGATCHWRR